MNTDTYKIGDQTYINLTNRCTNDCTFCVRNTGDGVGGYNLWLEREPEAEEVIAALAKDRTDVVFCGFGEPTIRIDTLLAVAKYVKSYGGKVRVNTNGHANAFHGRDVTPEMAEVVDEVSVSLNEADAEKYNKVTRCCYGEAGFGYLLDFAEKCCRRGMAVTLSVVDVIGEEDVEICRKSAEKIGAAFRVRHYIP